MFLVIIERKLDGYSDYLRAIYGECFMVLCLYVFFSAFISGIYSDQSWLWLIYLFRLKLIMDNVCRTAFIKETQHQMSYQNQ